MFEAFVDGLLAVHRGTEALAKLLRVDGWQACDETVTQWCEYVDGVALGRKTVAEALAAVNRWEAPSNVGVSDAYGALCAVLRGAAAHVTDGEGEFGLGRETPVCTVLADWQAAERWRDGATEAELGIPAKIGGQSWCKPEVVIYRPDGAKGPCLPTSDDAPRDVTHEAPLVRVTSPWRQARVRTLDARTTISHGDGSYSVVAGHTVQTYRSRADRLAARQRGLRAQMAKAHTQVRVDREAAVQALAAQFDLALHNARQLGQEGPVVVSERVIATCHRTARSVYLTRLDGSRIVRQDDHLKYARSLASALA